MSFRVLARHMNGPGTVLPLADNGCPKGWTRLDCHCYILQEDARSFADAESVCNILGGNLVSIHSALENSFVHELILAIEDPVDAWIGLHDAINQDGDFIWTDGTLEDFRAFNGTEPDTSGDCTQMNESGE
ncbi:lactose-binding lectin l-2-like [Hippocampus comes]|uniref:lactose-binding lectin l-2-like n=1 Tax=Hippocampus comes TaxID=109280 RepID=UPI00094EBF1A|nr:PREDICTED: lactose-binding lectin l-2-like [Hippocampus comes]